MPVLLSRRNGKAGAFVVSRLLDRLCFASGHMRVGGVGGALTTACVPSAPPLAAWLSDNGLLPSFAGGVLHGNADDEACEPAQ